MPYEWDEAKRRGNIGKHGIDFTAIRRFRWSTSQREQDLRHGEERIFALGYIGERLHAVSYTRRGGNIRIISLRKANLRETRRYDAP